MCSYVFWDKKNLVREVDVHEVDQEEKRVGSHERLSADSVDQRECLQKTNLARDRLLEGARDHLQALCDETKILKETKILRPEFPISIQRLLFSDAKFLIAMLTFFLQFAVKKREKDIYLGTNITIRRKG